MHFIGIDVSKKHLDIFILGIGKHQRFENNEAGHEALLGCIKLVDQPFVAMEATGGLEIRAAAKLAAHQVPVAVVNPRQVRDFAKSCGILAKTDKLDAQVIARFAEAVKPESRTLRDEDTQELHEIAARRRQLVDIRAVEKARLHQASKRVKRDIEETISWLDLRIKTLDAELDDFIKKSPVWRERDNLLRSIPCVGPALSAMLLADMQELGGYTRQQIAALAGVAPLHRDSGLKQGRRSTWGGRAQLRKVLYMAVVSGLQHNPVIRSFYDRLLKAGKPAKVALVACMRKLLTILNAVAKSGKPWDLSLHVV